MATRNFAWKTTNGTVYVDSAFGSDYQGDGTKTKPYQTIAKAYGSLSTTSSAVIVCRGLFDEDLTGKHDGCTIRGDYYGAAIFDGKSQHTLYGFAISNLIILNAMDSTSAALRGVGRAYNANYVGITSHPNNASGVAGSAAFIGNSGLYWGIIGGNTAVVKNVFWNPKKNSTYKISLGTNNAPCLNQCTVYGAGVDDVRKTVFSKTYTGSINYTLFSNFAIILNNAGVMTFNKCMFAADCKFYYFAGTDSTSTATIKTSDDDTATGYVEITPEGDDNDAKAADLITKLKKLYDLNGVTDETLQYVPTFNSCIFSSQSADEIFNNPEKGDMTLQMGCDADTNVYSTSYIGALPPALKLSIYATEDRYNNDGDPIGSRGITNAWDENTLEGCLTVKDKGIYINEDSNLDTGSIMSKVVTINIDEIQVDGIYSICESKWAQKYAVFRTDDDNGGKCIGTAYNAVPDGGLPEGLYVVSLGGVTISVTKDDVTTDYTIGESGVFRIEDGVTCTFADGTTVYQVIEPNAGEALYVRCRKTIYARKKAGEALKSGVTYLNTGSKTITVDNRTVAPMESFVCEKDGITFTTGDSEDVGVYSIAVMFDDADSTPETIWVPARFWGEYYVLKESGAIELDDYGMPLSSANSRSFTLSAGKSVINTRYIQFKIMVQKF